MSIDSFLIVTFCKGDQNVLDLRNEFHSFQEKIMASMKEFFDKQNNKITKLIEDFEELKTSIQFINDKYDEIKTQTEEIRSRLFELEKIYKSSQNKDDLIMEVGNKLDTLELNSRQCNIEIVNLPEKRNENLISIIENVAAAVKHPINKYDVIAIHRVPQFNPKSGRPKNVIVKFASRMLRDSFLSAARKEKSLTTEKLQMPGTIHKLYFNEHLTLKRKNLFREVRETAKKNGFRYTWIKHRSILVRANDTSPVLSIRSSEDLSKIKSKNCPVN
ncbi:unnamed protein product [Parnassius apollo]|uniref:(apollo) hypothetical protein n=1 Tax=Parnassius apollo TaxID=110799 RepID=A0A8S3XTM4_PARAO|nr:unnamed protein product [Parnassius apollo]